MLEKNDLPDWESVRNNYQGRTGIHLGFLADLRLGSSNFYFQPAMMISNKGRKYAETFDTSISSLRSISSQQFVNYIDMPLNLVLKLPLGKTTRFIIGAGPYISFFYNARHKTETITKDGIYSAEENNDPGVGNGPGKYHTFDLGANGLAGFEFGRVSLTANYGQGLRNFYQPADYAASRYRHKVIGATLGVFLGKTPEPAIKDRDGDGIPDKDDHCPDMPGLAAFKGCPDTDGDGISDAEDACPLAAGPKENKGCPYTDRDNDGVLDKDDDCPDTPGPADNKGCPYPDRDKDGIPDKDDKCPDMPGVARYAGCPVPDTDGDGVNDEEDQCIDQPGTRANKGCPEEIKKEIIEKVSYAAKKIQFQVNKAELTPGSKAVLDEVAELLEDNPALHLTIGGHTSNDGTRAFNIKLSQARADAVKSYILSKGIRESRLRAVGYGPDQPLNSGKTAAEKAANRRVELELSNQ